MAIYNNKKKILTAFYNGNIISKGYIQNTVVFSSVSQLNYKRNSIKDLVYNPTTDSYDLVN